MINGKPIYDLDRIIETSGFATAGDGGAGKWKQNGVTGQTPSQTPAQLGDALLNDANGNQWYFICDADVDVKGLGAKIDGVTPDQGVFNIAIQKGFELNKKVVANGVDAKISGEIQILDSVNRRPNIEFNCNFMLGDNSSITLGSTSGRLLDGFIKIKKIQGSGKGLGSNGLKILNAQFNTINIGLVEDCSNGIAITPNGFNCGDNIFTIGRIANSNNGILFNNDASVGVTTSWHAQNNKFTVGFIQNCDYGLRKTVDLTGAPMDLSHVVAGFDFNTVSDILDTQPDSKSTYDLLFSDADNNFTIKSLDGVGIETSFITKHYRGSAKKGMFIGFGDEVAGLLRYGNIRASGKFADESLPQSEINNTRKQAGEVAIQSFTHSDDERVNLVNGARVASTYISDNVCNLIMSVNDGGSLKGIVQVTGDSFRPTTDNSKKLGSAFERWSEVFAVNGSITTSDERHKKITDIDDVERSCAKAIKSQIKKFKWLDAIDKKGSDNARVHFGVGAQTVKLIFEQHNLNPDDYSLFCYDEWEDIYQNTEVEPDKFEYKLVAKAGNRYGIRYDELLMFILSSI